MTGQIIKNRNARLWFGKTSYRTATSAKKKKLYMWDFK